MNILYLGRKKIIPLPNQITFLNRLHKLLKSGYTFNRALSLLTFDPSLGTIARKVENRLKKGNSLEEILRTIGFSNIVVSFLYFSKTTGQLETSLFQSAQLLRQQQQFMQRAKKALQYPTILFMFLLFLFLSLKLFLIPSLTSMFENFHGAQNISSLFSIIDFISTFFLISVLLCFILYILWKLIHRKLTLQSKTKLYNLIPIVRKFKKLEISYYFSFHFSTLLLNGLSVKSTLQIMAEQKHLPFIQLYANKLVDGVYNGQPLQTTLSTLPFIEKELCFIVERGLIDNSLEKDLYNYSEMLIDSIVERMNKVITFIQPITFIFFGGLILFIYFSILVPMFQLLQQI